MNVNEINNIKFNKFYKLLNYNKLKFEILKY